jgi:hypothetical protein
MLEMVDEFFEQCLAGRGAKSIAVALNDSGVLLRGRPWSKETVSNILSSWVCCGYVILNRRDRQARRVRPESEWVKTKGDEAIIPEENFMAVCELVASRAPRAGKGSANSTQGT